MPFSRSGPATQEESNKNSWNRVKQLLVQLLKEGKKWPACTELILITSFQGGRTFLFTWCKLKLTWEEGQDVISWDLPCHKFSEWPQQNRKTFCFCVYRFIGLELIDTLTYKYIESTQRRKNRLRLSQTLCGLHTFSNKIKYLAVDTTSIKAFYHAFIDHLPMLGMFWWNSRTRKRTQTQTLPWGRRAKEQPIPIECDSGSPRKTLQCHWHRVTPSPILGSAKAIPGQGLERWTEISWGQGKSAF